jgi:hypothetical protein
MRSKGENRKKLAGRDIAIPGSDMYDTLENLGIEEQEYNFYHLGSEGHSDEEEDTEENIALNYHWFISTIKNDSRKSV